MRPKKSDSNSTPKPIINDKSKSELELEILNYRIRGLSIPEISKLSKLSESKITKIINKKTTEQIEQITLNYDIQLLELNEIKKNLWKHINTNPSGCSEKLLKTISEINKMLGLYDLANDEKSDSPLLIHITGNKKQAETMNQIKIEDKQIDLQRKKGELVPIDLVEKQISILTRKIDDAKNKLIKQFGQTAGDILMQSLNEAKNFVDEIDEKDTI